MTILITGVAGFIGSRFARWVLENTQDSIVGVDDLSGGFIFNLPDKTNRFVFYKEDICNRKAIDEIFKKEQPDLVYNFAAYAAENLSPFIRCFNYTNNLVGTASIVNACIKYNIKRLIFTSSLAVYGNGNPPFIEETSPTIPNDPYGNAKLACEIDIKIANDQHGLDYCILRPYNVYGVGQNINDKYRNVLGIWMRQAINNDPITIFGDGLQFRNFSCIDDMLLPMYISGISKNASMQTINIGSEKGYTIKEIADIFQKVSNQDLKIKFLEKRHEVKMAYCDNTKAKGILGYVDQVSVEDGVKSMWAWVNTMAVSGFTKSPEFEIENGIYQAWR